MMVVGDSDGVGFFETPVNISSNITEFGVDS